MKNSPYKELALITQVGLNVAVPIVAAVLVGGWLDKKLGADYYLLLIMTLIGIAAGIGNILRLGKKL